ncbi:MAG TPA: NADPH dehydrogenase NamA [Ferruginibacter sp.]|jgi:2,4-dienoyl-CoA reductase-like NADH-dependent reductase (Old Yellow Enzyme family)|nr:NADPH dehydrogenase NamA [Ferruginibacter sp.]
MAKLFEPLQIKSVTLKNRIAVSPMCEYSSEDGFANDWHLVHLGSRAVGGAGLVIMEATAVSPEGRITPSDMGIWKDEHISGLQRITTFIHQHNAVAGIQLAHAGRKGSNTEPWNGSKEIGLTQGGWKVVAPSAIPFYEGADTPAALTEEGIKKVIADFKAAAQRAYTAGFKIIEIHAAHGYLINEFLSPFSNQRTDNYGGSFDNRTRLLIEVVTAIKSVWPADFPLFVRISATDWKEGGWDIEQSVTLSKRLKELGVDLIDCSSGGVIPNVKIPLVQGYQVPLSTQVKKEAAILTGTVGLITNAKQAEEILQNQQADLILLAREFLRDPYFPLHAAKELNVDVKWPVQYERAK